MYRATHPFLLMLRYALYSVSGKASGKLRHPLAVLLDTQMRTVPFFCFSTAMPGGIATNVLGILY